MNLAELIWNIQMEGESMSMTDDKILLPEVIVYAGPNGSGKTTITKMAKLDEYKNEIIEKAFIICT